MTWALAESILVLDSPEADATRIEELNVKANEGRLTDDEEAELEAYVNVSDLLAYWQSKARQSLRQQEWLADPSIAAGAIFNNHILRSKVNYQFNRELTLRAIFDYNGVLPNSTLVSLDRSKRLGADVLLTYLLHPGTALYIGYSDVRENLAYNPLMSSALQRTTFPDTTTGRQVFIKLSYLLRY